MKIFDSANCEILCLKKNENGCCFLHHKNGCYWKPGGTASDGTGTGISVTCRTAGRTLAIVFKNQNFNDNISNNHNNIVIAVIS